MGAVEAGLKGNQPVFARRAQRAATSLDSSWNKCSNKCSRVRVNRNKRPRVSRQQIQDSLERMELVSVHEQRLTKKEFWNESSQTFEPKCKSVTVRGVSVKTPTNFRNCQKMGLPMICKGDGHQSYVPCRCDSKVCESCCQRQGKRVRQRYSKPVKESLANRRRGYSLKLLTVTRAIPKAKRLCWLFVSN
jgi:hypothetical protein